MATQTYTDGVTLSAAAEFNRFDTVSYAVLSGVAGTNTITATGPANYTYAATTPPVWFIPANTNTGPTTINITPSGGAALSAKNIFSYGAALTGGELQANVPAGVVYDGTQFNIVGPSVPVSGSWTPTIIGSVTPGTQTYGTQAGAYRKIGTMVLFSAFVSISAKDAGIAGNVRIGGLPFSVANNSSAAGAGSIGDCRAVNLTAGYTQLLLNIPQNASSLALFEVGDNVDAQAVLVAAIPANAYFQISGFYFTA